MNWEKLDSKPAGVVGVRCLRSRTAGGWLFVVRSSGGLGRWVRSQFVADPDGTWVPGAWERVDPEAQPGEAEIHRTPVPGGWLFYTHVHGFSGPGGDVTFVPEGRRG